MAAPHPAKFSQPIVELLARLTEGQPLVLDPFAGVGLVHQLTGVDTSVGLELEPEWAAQAPRDPSCCTVVGNALQLPFRCNSVPCVATSPTYGNRMADHHEARDSSKRHTYRHYLGRPLHPANTGQLQWGPVYRRTHQAAWAEVWRVLVPGGLFLLNTSNHIRAGKVIEVTEWHLEVCRGLGFELHDTHFIETPRQRHGQNGELRVGYESIMGLVKP
jgi:hypothetical protein